MTRPYVRRPELKIKGLLRKLANDPKVKGDIRFRAVEWLAEIDGLRGVEGKPPANQALEKLLERQRTQ